VSIVVGIDLSLTSAGIAILRDGKPIQITHVGHKGRDGASYRDRSRRVRSQCQAVLRACDIALKRLQADVICDLAVIEGPSYGSQFGHEFDRAALWHGVYGALEARGVPIAVIAPNTLKLWFTGNGAASKTDMTNTAMARFREPISTHDEADAVALATAGAYKLGDPIPFEPKERQREALAKVEWPGVTTCH
jgi:Holliday junction resolvasome RuvABC endonuclease subunit